MNKMDLRQAKACLDEYRISLDAKCGMLKRNAADGALRDAVEKLNDSLSASLEVHSEEALILSIIIRRQMIAREDQILDFPDEWAELDFALNKLKVATDQAEQARAEYLRTKKADEGKKKGKEEPNATVLAIQKFKHEKGLMKNQEREEYDRNAALKEST
jgi:hypothetical protein